MKSTTTQPTLPVARARRPIRIQNPGAPALLFALTAGHWAYALAKPAAQISIVAIARAVDGPLAPLPCASVRFYRRCSDCKDEKTCEVRRLMRQVRDAASAILDNTSWAEAAYSNDRKRRGEKLAKSR